MNKNDAINKKDESSINELVYAVVAQLSYGGFLDNRLTSGDAVEILKRFVKNILTSPASHQQYTLEDIIEAAKYAFFYAYKSQSHDNEIPEGSILQWLMNRKGYTQTSQLYSSQPPISDAIEFAEWIGENKYVRHTGKPIYIAAWNNYSQHTATELYQIFKQQSSK